MSGPGASEPLEPHDAAAVFEKLKEAEAEGRSGDGKLVVWARVADCQVTRVQLVEGAWAFYQTLRDQSGQLIGREALRAATLEAIHKAESAALDKKHASLTKPEKRPDAAAAFERAAEAGEIDWDHSFIDFQRDYYSRLPKPPTEAERRERDEKAGFGREHHMPVETDPAKILATPVGKKVGPISERAMAWRAEQSRRLGEFSKGATVAAGDHDTSPTVAVQIALGGIVALDVAGNALASCTAKQYEDRVVKAARKAHEELRAALALDVPEEFGWAQGPIC
ncbi:hypothetical protein [Segniliparus rugosus]|uniref:Uncharacterized protein n=1 Tax=Segniliparus rugosus (strain ATCC BAA-974 / DSM 45345 / CCUG 50838 / CIP 108380 / JCM 13579 / CDC 945) TaxID=679197 RepID=U1M1J7_SEGRC|nr:hypothetical protein [Segniliparus rugosus]ERG69252.1 hypothetical protein HMPREF9336_04143 [Segniliparus rugosus ATCC BAA-974]